MDSLPEPQAKMRGEFAARWPEMVSGTISSHALENAPVAKSPRRFPLVTFSHGLGGSGFNYTSLIEDVVSHGYVVAAIEHTYLALAVSFPDGRVVLRRSASPRPGLSPEERASWVRAQTTVEVDEGAADVRFVLDQVIGAQTDPRQFPLAGRIDTARIAAMGHSAGAEFAARACQLDTRIKACVDLDGAMVPISALPEYADGATLKQPLLFLEADHPESQMGGTPAEHAAYFRKKDEQFRQVSRGSYDVIVKSPGIAHPSFTDIPLLFAGQDGFPPRDIVLHNLNLIQAYVREFLGKVLRQEGAPLLDGINRGNAEVTVQVLGC